MVLLTLVGPPSSTVHYLGKEKGGREGRRGCRKDGSGGERGAGGRRGEKKRMPGIKGGSGERGEGASYQKERIGSLPPSLHENWFYTFPSPNSHRFKMETHFFSAQTLSSCKQPRGSWEPLSGGPQVPARRTAHPARQGRGCTDLVNMQSPAPPCSPAGVQGEASVLVTGGSGGAWAQCEKDGGYDWPRALA